MRVASIGLSVDSLCHIYINRVEFFLIENNCAILYKHYINTAVNNSLHRPWVTRHSSEVKAVDELTVPLKSSRRIGMEIGLSIH